MLKCPGLALCPSYIPEEVCVNQMAYAQNKDLLSVLGNTCKILTATR
jgi:hypothetical protein